MLFVDYVIKSKKSAIFDIKQKCQINKKDRKANEYLRFKLFNNNFNDIEEITNYERNKLNDLKNKCITLFHDLLVCFNELDFLEMGDAYAYYSQVKDSLEKISEVNDLYELKYLLEELYSSLVDYCNTIDEYTSINEDWHYNEEVNINQDIVKKLLSKIKSDRKINVFDTKCRTGELLKFVDDNFNANIYGLEINNDSAETAKKVATKIAKGDLARCNITNNVFDVIIAPTSLSFDKKDNISLDKIDKIEYKYLEQCYRYLNSHGLLIYIIPAFRMHKDICMYIAKRFTDVYICQDDDNYGLVYILARKKTNNIDLDQDIFSKLRSCYSYKNIDSFDEDKVPEYNIQSSLCIVKNFKGSRIDYDEYYNMVENSGLMDKLFDNQKVEKIDESIKRPLLPFNIGQIGLVMASGCLDGVIEEDNGCCHLIKGKVSKEEVVRNSIDDIREVRTCTEIETNNVEINVLLPNGEFKNLT